VFPSGIVKCCDEWEGNMKRILLLPLLMISAIGLAQDPVKVDPAHYFALFENTHTRVLEDRDKPGDKAP
jgi:hypothetical protein